MVMIPHATANSFFLGFFMQLLLYYPFKHSTFSWEDGSVRPSDFIHKFSLKMKITGQRAEPIFRIKRGIIMNALNFLQNGLILNFNLA